MRLDLPRIALVHALAVIASGLYNFVVNGGVKGLWFGFAMGALGITAALLARRQRILFARICLGLACALVGGWFGYEAFIKAPEKASLRMGLMIGLSVFAFLMIFRSHSDQAASDMA